MGRKRDLKWKLGTENHIISKTRKKVKESEKQHCQKKIGFQKFWEVWRLSHARGNVVFQIFDIMSTFHGHCWRIHIKIFSALRGWCTIFFLIFCIFYILFDLAAGQRRAAWYPKYPNFAKRSKTAVFFPFFLKAFGFQHSEIYTSKEISSQHNISFGCFSSAGFSKIL